MIIAIIILIYNRKKIQSLTTVSIILDRLINKFQRQSNHRSRYLIDIPKYLDFKRLEHDSDDPFYDAEDQLLTDENGNEQISMTETSSSPTEDSRADKVIFQIDDDVMETNNLL